MQTANSKQGWIEIITRLANTILDLYAIVTADSVFPYYAFFVQKRVKANAKRRLYLQMIYTYSFDYTERGEEKRRVKFPYKI